MGSERALERDSDADPGAARATFVWAEGLLGLDQARPTPAGTDVVPSDVQAFADARQLTSTNKDWSQADSLRDAMAALGWTVTDTAAGQ